MIIVIGRRHRHRTRIEAEKLDLAFETDRGRPAGFYHQRAAAERFSEWKLGYGDFPRSTASTIVISLCWVALVFSIWVRSAPFAPLAKATSDIATALVMREHLAQVAFRHVGPFAAIIASLYLISRVVLAVEQRFHLRNFGLLARNDSIAQLLDLGIRNFGLLAHQDRA